MGRHLFFLPLGNVRIREKRRRRQALSIPSLNYLCHHLWREGGKSLLRCHASVRSLKKCISGSFVLGGRKKASFPSFPLHFHPIPLFPPPPQQARLTQFPFSPPPFFLLAEWFSHLVGRAIQCCGSCTTTVLSALRKARGEKKGKGRPRSWTRRESTAEKKISR